MPRVNRLMASQLTQTRQLAGSEPAAGQAALTKACDQPDDIVQAGVGGAGFGHLHHTAHNPQQAHHPHPGVVGGHDVRVGALQLAE